MRDILEQIKGGASQLFETLGDGWGKLVTRNGKALTRFTRRRDAEKSADLPEVTESWGLLPGEVAETDSHVVVRLEAPGMEKGDFEIQVDNGMLLIRGEKRFERDRCYASYHVFEAAYGAFERALVLPSDVEAGRAEAHYRRGVLTVTLPRTAARNLRKIAVG